MPRAKRRAGPRRTARPGATRGARPAARHAARRPGPPVVTLLSDFGAGSGYPAQMKAVLLSALADVRVVDLSHDVPHFDVLSGALLLESCVSRFPVRAVHCAVVDPGVGTARRGLCVVARDGRRLVGPDNGIFTPFLDGARVHELSSPRHVPVPASATFHGRDVFAPVAAHLAAGEVLGAAGDPIDPDTLAQLALPRWRLEGDAIVANVLYVDRFGNAALDITHDDLAQTGFAVGDRLELDRGGERFFAHVARMFVDVRVGEILVYEDAYGTLAVAINRGNAAETLQLAIDAELVIRRA